MNSGVERIVDRRATPADPVEVLAELSGGAAIRQSFASAGTIGGAPAVAFRSQSVGRSARYDRQFHVRVFTAAEGAPAVPWQLVYVMSRVTREPVLVAQSVVQIVAMVAQVSRVEVSTKRTHAVVTERVNGAAGRRVRDVLGGETVAAQPA